jgi:uncharacterized membrane protein YgcG
MAEDVVFLPLKPETNWLLEAILLVLFIGFVAVSSLAIDFIFSSYGLFSVLLKLAFITAGFFAYCNLSSLKIIGWAIGAIAALFMVLLFSGLIAIVPPEYWAFLAVVFIGGIMQSKLHSSFLNRETSEAKVFAVIVIVVLLALGGTYLAKQAIGAVSGGVSVSFQDVTVSLYDDSIIIDRTLHYAVSGGGQFHELYISVNKDSQSAVSLQSESCPYGFRFIQNDYGDYVEYVCRDDNGIPAGDYDVRFAYSISRPYEKGTDFADPNYVISDAFGLNVDRMRVTFINNTSKSAIQELFTYPYGSISGNSVEMGAMGPQVPFSVRALLSNPGYLSSYKDVNYAIKPDFDRTRLAASLDKAVFDYRIIVLSLLAIGFIAALFLLYERFGKEDAVPFDIDTLHTVPNEKRKPWEVNLLFVGTPDRMDSNALYATLMDLESRGIIKIESENKIIYNGVPEGQALDEYETNVVNLLSSYGTKSQNGQCVFDAQAVKPNLTANRSLAAVFASDFSKVSDYPNAKNTGTCAKRLAESAFDQKGYDAAKAFVSGSLLASIWLFGGAASAYSWDVMLPLMVFLSALLVMIIAFGEYLFGKYTHEMIIEKKKWDAFSNLLSNYGMIQKYGKEEILMWKNWLVYATALGVAEKAISQMRQYGKEMSDSAYLSLNRTTRFAAIGFYAVNSHAMAMSPSHGGHGGFGGGGFGGGGHGGGGGGAR